MPIRRACSFAMLVLLACGGASRPPVASISLIPSSAPPLTSLGDTLQLTAVPLDSTGAPIPGVGVSYTSSDATVATVTQGGLVTAVGNGNATIHASAEGKEATLAVSVAQVVAQVVVTPTALLVPAGEIPLFHASALDARGHPVGGAPAPVWTTSNPAVATIGADGRAAVSSTAVKGDIATAIATVGTVASTSGGAMTVDPSAVYVETISVAPGATSFSSLGDQVQLSATATNPRRGDVTASVTFAWSSSASGVAGVSTAGLVTALGNGNAAVSASWNGVSGSASIAVAQVVASVSVRPATASIPRCTTQQFAATARDARGNAVVGAPAPTWSSSATSVATVDANGLSRGASVGGPVAISATVGSVTGSAQLTVNSSPITVNWSSAAAVTPVNVTTCVGQSVVFHNTDTNLAHTATGTSGPPVTGDIQPGASSVGQTFPLSGSYAYHCDYHPNETGTVFVSP
jgi:plastocyanin